MSELAGDAWQLSPSAQEALRLRAVAALVAGRTREDVAVVFQVSLKGVDNWWAQWLAGGREALVARPRGRRSANISSRCGRAAGDPASRTGPRSL
ncbi:helix-turn-helix domain-containing protein [Streptomyces sp. NPDC001340]